MHNLVLDYSHTLSFALLTFIILYIHGNLFRCNVFTFVQYILFYQMLRNMMMHMERIEVGCTLNPQPPYVWAIASEPRWTSFSVFKFSS